MTNLAIIALAFTLAAEGSAPASETTSAPAKAPVAASASIIATNDASAPATLPAAPAPTTAVAPIKPPVAKPAESDVEVLSEVVDLQETEDPHAAWYGQAYPNPVRILALPTARAVKKGGFEFVIDHRASSPIWNTTGNEPWSNMANDLFGFDDPIQVGLGLRYGVIDDLDVGLYRAGSYATDTYEFDARYQAFHQADMGVDLAVRAGVTWFSQRDVEDASGFYGQLLATRLFINRVLLSAGWFYHSNSTNDRKYNQDTHYSTAGGAGVEVRLAGSVSLDAEMISCVAGYCSKNPTFSGGVKFLTNRHTFALVCGNTQYLTADGYITNTDRPWKQLAIGFNITREY